VQKVSVVNLAKRYGDAMKASVKTMGPEMLDANKVVRIFRLCKPQRAVHPL